MLNYTEIVENAALRTAMLWCWQGRAGQGPINNGTTGCSPVQRIFEFIVNYRVSLLNATFGPGKFFIGAGRAGPHPQWENKVRLQPSALQTIGVLPAPLHVTVCPWKNFLFSW